MHESATILIYGTDPQLLETRRLLVQSCGHAVWGTTKVCGVPTELASRPVDLVILCHSLSRLQCEITAAFVRRRWPAAQLLSMTLVDRDDIPELSPHVIYAMDDPRRLLDTVNTLVHWPPQAA